MNKNELVQALAESTGFSKADAERLLSAFRDTVAETLSRGGELALPGLGKFTVKERAARTGRNPRTGEPVEIAASKVPSFKAAAQLKQAVNG